MSRDRPGGERFVVQKASGKKWETLTVHDAQADGAAAFAAAVRGTPRAFLRLIRLQADPDARGEVYDWTLVSLHDPRRNPVPPAAPSGAPARRKSADKSTGKRQMAEERVRVPVRLYIGLFLSGAALVMLWLLAGRLR
ncbi:hypothetical protein SAE02_50220 [Skermanella aerolata]|uniref:Uncharacterized protein n=1 Tax=Skermanella aerolata TaxID=393310 RepID=A0A512DWM4_9PROT|nr:hypothetical protein [Skermanella aerolata]KJB93774.1 hypothetical protein N826_14055 [Skermanella aerolata KACC 11604]GEO40874.1 hypothetical protein SAE02_50220 [Skermanella aerolata]